MYMMNADGTDKHQVLGTDKCIDQPTWSPDGKHIAYFGPAGRGGFMTLWVVNADGTHDTYISDYVAACCLKWEDDLTLHYNIISVTRKEGVSAYLDGDIIMSRNSPAYFEPQVILPPWIHLPEWVKRTNTFSGEYDQTNRYYALTQGGLVEKISKNYWTNVLFLYDTILNVDEYIINAEYPQWRPGNSARWQSVGF